MDAKLYQDIREELGHMAIVDSHSHIAPEAAWKNSTVDFMDLLGYSCCDTVSAGLSRDQWIEAMAGDSRMRSDYGYDYVPDSRTPQEKWDAIKGFWPFVKNIGSGYLVQKALHLLCDESDLTDENILTIGEKLDAWRKKYPTYEEFFRKNAGIDYIFGVTMDTAENPTSEVVKQQLYTDVYTGVQKRRDLYRIEQLTGQPIYNLKTYLQALDILIDQQVQAGIVALKWHFYPYMRPLEFELASPFVAEQALAKILKMPMRGATGSAVSAGFDEMKPLHNYLQHYIVEKAIEYDMPIQIHTGTFGGTLGAHIEYSRPNYLVDMFKRYPNVKFNILHSSFPYQREAGELARIFPNVFVNASWVDTLSPMAFMGDMKEWLTYIPTNKIFAFGSDQFNAFMTWASAENVRDMLATVFAELIEEGRYDKQSALWCSQRILRDNVLEFYGL